MKFPALRWKNIADHYRKVFRKNLAVCPKPILDGECFYAYYQRVSGKVFCLVSGNGERWAAQDLARLTELVHSDAPQLEIAAAFPTRRWYCIRQKISDLFGIQTVIRGMTLPQSESYYEYLDRTNPQVLEPMRRDLTQRATAVMTQWILEQPEHPFLPDEPILDENGSSRTCTTTEGRSEIIPQ
jgi:hypothetical protein